MITVPGRVTLTTNLTISLTQGQDSDGEPFVNAQLWEAYAGNIECIATGTGDHESVALIDLLLDMDAEGVTLPTEAVGILRGLAQSAIELICASLTEAAP